MKVCEIVDDLLVEAISKNLYNELHNIWVNRINELNPNISNEDLYEKINFIYEQFKTKQEGLSPNRPQVVAFLHRYDGSTVQRTPYFDPKNLKMIGKYTYDQVVFLLGEYDINVDNKSLKNDTENPIFLVGGRTNRVNGKWPEEKIKASYDLWTGRDNLVFEEGTLRIYNPGDQKTAYNYGYYMGSLSDKLGTPQWCVTQPGGNWWNNYRNRRTFYFVIDDSKDKDNNKFCLSALQICISDDDSSTGFKLTSVRNDGDVSMTPGEIYNIYPQLRGKLNKSQIQNDDYIFKFIKYNSSNELLNGDDPLNLINETPGSPHEFAIQSIETKRRYINTVRPLSKPKSWQVIDTSLREAYIGHTDRANVDNRFMMFDFVGEIKKNNNDFNRLKHRLEIIGYGGIAALYAKLMTSFRVYLRNKINPNIVIYYNTNNNKYGIFNVDKAEWVQNNGIKYEPNFNNIGIKTYRDENDKRGFVQEFSTSGPDSSTSFYSIIPEEGGKKQPGFFLSHKQFEELKENEHITTIEKKLGLIKSLQHSIKGFDPETHSDIKEIKKGL